MPAARRRPSVPTRLAGAVARAAAAGALLAFVVGARPLAAQASARSAQVRAELLLADRRVAPGAATELLVRLVVADGWYLYWRHPGESGLPTRLEVAAPAGWRVLDVAWPVPERLQTAGLAVHALRDTVAIVARLAAPDDAKRRDDVAVVLHFGVCREVCIPQTLRLRRPLAVGVPARPDSRARAAIARARARLPRVAALGELRLRRPSGSDRVCLRWTGAPAGRELLVVPDSGQWFPAAVRLPTRREGTALAAELPSLPADRAGHAPARLRGVLRIEGGGQEPAGVEIDAPVEVGPGDSCGGE